MKKQGRKHLAKKFPGKLKSLRTAKGWSLVKAGLEIGIAPNMIYLMESGRRLPDLPTITLIADAFQVSVDYLLGRTRKRKSDLTSDLKPEPKEVLNTDREVPRIDDLPIYREEHTPEA